MKQTGYFKSVISKNNYINSCNRFEEGHVNRLGSIT
jgi:hypothetical protein